MLYIFFSKICRLYENVENTAEQGRSQMTIWRMRIARWTPKSTNAHSYYVTLIAFPLQQRLHERAPMLRDNYTVLLRSVMNLGARSRL